MPNEHRGQQYLGFSGDKSVGGMKGYPSVNLATDSPTHCVKQSEPPWTKPEDLPED
ncbi:MAG: hypothetical protein R3C56_32490 [Pirellulaceae bacterium]